MYRYRGRMTMLQSNTTSVAGRLLETRRMAGLSSRAIAPLIGVGHATISRWENGLAEPSVTQFALWARATGQSLEHMIAGLEMKEPRDLARDPEAVPCTPSDLNREPTDSESDAFWAIVRRIEAFA